MRQWIIAGSLVALTGCSAKDEAPKTPAAPAVASAPAPAAAPAEAPAAEAPAEAPAEPQTPEEQLKARLVGEWHLDLQTIEADPDIARLPADQKAQAVAMAQEMLSDVTFTFTADGQLTLGFGPGRRSGTYVIDAIEGNALRITAKTGEGEGELVEKVLLRIEGDAMWVTEGADNRTLRLLRGKAPVAQALLGGSAAGSQPMAPGSQPMAPGSQPMALPPGHPVGAGGAMPAMPPGHPGGAMPAMPPGHPGGAMPPGHPGGATPAMPPPGHPGGAMPPGHPGGAAAPAPAPAPTPAPAY